MERIKNNTYFRNRLSSIRNILFKNKSEKQFFLADGLIIILGSSSNYNHSHHKFANWLIFNYSNLIDLEEKSIPSTYLETFIILTHNNLFIFTDELNSDNIINLTTYCGVSVQYYFYTKEEFEKNDLFQNTKIAKFIEYTNLLKKVAMPLTFNEIDKKIDLEKWPLINSYGIDLLNLGFFTLDKEIVDLSPYLDNHRNYFSIRNIDNIDGQTKDLISLNSYSNMLYFQHDLSSIINYVPLIVKKQETLIHDFLLLLEKEKLKDRLLKTESYLFSNTEIELLVLNYDKYKTSKFNYLQNLPYPSIRFGPNTNTPVERLKLVEPLKKLEYDVKTPSLHCIYENVDPVTGIRVARSYFLNSLQKDIYIFDNYSNSNDKITTMPNKIYTELFFLTSIYVSLIQFLRIHENKLLHLYLNKSNKSSDNKNFINYFNKFKDELIKVFDRIYEDEQFMIIRNFNSNSRINSESIMLNINEYGIMSPCIKSNSMSNIEETNIKNKFIIINIRIEIKNIISPVTNLNLYNLCYSDSYLYALSDKIYNLTKDILPLKYSYTSDAHICNLEFGENNFNKQSQEYIFYRNLKYSKSILNKQINYKGLIFLKNKYSFDYLFPSSSDLGFDNNSMFLTFNGNIFLMKEVILFEDNNLGSFSLLRDSIIEIYEHDINNNVFILFKLSDIGLSTIPYSGIIKDELLLYIRKDFTNTNIINDFRILLINSVFNNKINVNKFDENKLFEYDLCFKTYIDNFDKICEDKSSEVLNDKSNYKFSFENNFVLTNLHEITNDYNLTNIMDEISCELPEVENFINLGIEKNFNSYLKSIKNFNYTASILLGDNSEDKNKYNTTNVLLLVGPNEKYINLFSKSLCDFFNIKGIKCDLNNNKIKNNLTIMPIVSLMSGDKLYQDIISSLDLTLFNKIFFAYVFDLKSLIIDSKGKYSNQLLSIGNSKLFKYGFYDTDMISDSKYLKYLLKLIKTVNKEITLFNNLNINNKTKSIINIISSQNNNENNLFQDLVIDNKEDLLNKNYFDYYKLTSCYLNTIEKHTIKQKYKYKMFLLNNYLQSLINSPLISTIENLKNSKEVIILNNNDTNSNLDNNTENNTKSNRLYIDNELEYLINALKSLVSKLLNNQKQPSIYCITGKIKDENNELFEIYANCNNYKCFNIKNNNKDNSEYFLEIYGFNLKSYKNEIDKMFEFFCGEFPKKKNFFSKKDVSIDERNNLNIIGLFKPLPKGWTTDGPIYIDHDNKRYSDHPNIDEFIEEYLHINNTGIKEYNENIDLLIKKLEV